MRDGGRGGQNQRARQKLDDEVAALGCVEAAQKLHRAPPEWEVAYVAVLVGADAAEIEGGAGEDRLRERAPEVREAPVGARV